MSLEFSCPHCKGSVQFTVSLEAGSALLRPETKAEKEARWFSEAPAAIRAFLEEGEQAGWLESFLFAVQQIPASARPSMPRKFLFTTLARMGPMTAQPHVYEYLRESFPGHRIDLWGVNGIVAVVTGNTLRAFVAKSVLDAIGPAAPIAPDLNGEWVRTKFGYVTSPMLFDEFRRRALGAWDHLTGGPR